MDVDIYEPMKYLNYDSESGLFTWAVSPGQRIKIGAIAGTFTKKGYRTILLKGKQYLAHRLAWRFYYGMDPTAQIDHINRVRDDNRISNLRIATHTQNQWNRAPKKDGKTKGVRFCKRSKKWLVEMYFDGRKRQIGKFDDEAAAIVFAVEWIREAHGEFSIY